jgi:hypothetical protein
MIYSVWDYRRKEYDYFEGPGETPPTGSFRAPLAGLGLPESVACPLPANSERVGRGPQAKGVIAVTARGLGELQGSKATAAHDGSGANVGGLGDAVGGAGTPGAPSMLPLAAALGLAWLVWRKP